MVDRPDKLVGGLLTGVLEGVDEIEPIERERRSDNGIGVVGNRLSLLQVTAAFPAASPKPKGSVDFADLSLREQIRVGLARG
jgi:hypothetical protein